MPSGICGRVPGASTGHDLESPDTTERNTVDIEQTAPQRPSGDMTMDQVWAGFDACIDTVTAGVWRGGSWLLQAKASTPHGVWADRLAERNLNDRTAQRWMQVAREMTEAEFVQAGSLRRAVGTLVAKTLPPNTTRVSDLAEVDTEVVEPSEVIPGGGEASSAPDDEQPVITESEMLREQLAAVETRDAEKAERIDRLEAETVALRADAGDAQAGVEAQRRVDEVQVLKASNQRLADDLVTAREDYRKLKSVLKAKDSEIATLRSKRDSLQAIINTGLGSPAQAADGDEPHPWGTDYEPPDELPVTTVSSCPMSAVVLRDYQQDAVERLRVNLARRRTPPNPVRSDRQRQDRDCYGHSVQGPR